MPCSKCKHSRTFFAIVPEADRSASPPSSTRPPEGVDISLYFSDIICKLRGAIAPESDRSALLEFDYKFSEKNFGNE